MRARWLAIALAVAAFAALPPLTANAAAPLRPAPALAAHAASVTAVPKFIFHAGLAFGAFHHFIYLPYTQGKFTHGSIFSKLKAYVEAGLAALFVYHEVKLALADAQQNKVLKGLIAPLTAAVALFDTLLGKVKGHNLDATTVGQVQSSVASIESQAKGAGSTISEAIPSSKQLAAGSA